MNEKEGRLMGNGVAREVEADQEREHSKEVGLTVSENQHDTSHVSFKCFIRYILKYSPKQVT